MKPLLLLLLSILLLALPDQVRPEGVRLEATRQERRSTTYGAVLHTGAVHTGAEQSVTAPVGAVLTIAGHSGATLTKVVSSTCSNSKTKKCIRRKCLKHHREASYPAGAVPSSGCSFPLFAVLSQLEILQFSLAADEPDPQFVYNAHLLAAAQKREPRPPRFF